jgi:hypothetical protein
MRARPRRARREPPLRHHLGLLWILSRPDLYRRVLPDAEPAPRRRRPHARAGGAAFAR